MPEKIENILFDLDGTLTDPKEGIVNSILYALNKMGISENHLDELDSFIGPPLRDSFMMRYKLSENLANKAINYYREYFSEKGLFENKLYPGVAKLLKSLSTRYYHLYVATSKPTVYSKKIINHFNLNPYFVEIIGSHLDNTRTDKTEIISHILSKYNLQASQTIMIGDRKHDLIGAKNNSVKTMGVTYGYGSFEELSSQQPDYIVHDCKGIESIFLK